MSAAIVPSDRGRSLSRILAVAWLILLTVAVAAAPLLTHVDPLAQDLLVVQAPPSADHLLGTDSLGRDLLTRLLYGGRSTLLGVAIGVTVSLTIGIVAGLVAGFIRGPLDTALSFTAEILMSLPALILLITVLAVFPHNLAAAMVTFGLLSSAAIFRIVRNETLGVAQELYITAATLTGLSRPQVVRRHVLPQIRRTATVQGSIVAALALVMQTGLGFLGLDARPPQPTWGSVLQDAAGVISVSTWPLLPPSALIILTVLAFGVLGDAAGPGRAPARRTPPHRSRRVTLPAPSRGGSGDALLVVEHLSVILETGARQTTLVDDVSFELRPGEIVGLVGESGAGKSITARTVLGLPPRDTRVEGRITLHGTDLTVLGDRRRHRLRGKKIAFVGQEPMMALDPTFRVGRQIEEAVRTHRGTGSAEARRITAELLAAVRIPDPSAVARRYPHEISGGMAQRVCIAIALAGDPELLIADEPTTALDVTVQAEILALLRTLQHERHLAVLLITHDWGVVADLCDRAVVLYAGQVVEEATTGDLFDSSAHPYTLALRAADPHRRRPGGRLASIAGTVPAPGSWPAGCRFAPRCALATTACERSAVPLTPLSGGHSSRCLRIDSLRAQEAHHA